MGLAAAKAFAQTGAKIFLSSRRAATLEKAKAEIESLGGEVGFATVDVTDSKSVEAGVAAAVKRFGKIDIVIANAGKDGEPGKSGSLLSFGTFSAVCAKPSTFSFLVVIGRAGRVGRRGLVVHR